MLLVDQHLQRAVGVEEVVAVEGRALAQRPGQAAERGDVEERQRAPLAVVLRRAPGARGGQPAADEGLVGEHRAARLGGRAGGVEDQRGGAQRDALDAGAQLGVGRRSARRTSLRETKPGGCFAPIITSVGRSSPRASSQQRRVVDVVVGGVVREQRGQLGVVDDEAQLGRAVAGVDRDHDGADHATRRRRSARGPGGWSSARRRGRRPARRGRSASGRRLSAPSASSR